MSIRYVLHPGPVISEIDNETHIIPATNLAKLYQIPIQECIILAADANYEQQRNASAQMTHHRNLLHLHPRAKGDYVEHLKAMRENMRNRYK